MQNTATSFVEAIFGALYQLVVDIISAIPILFVAVIIWWLGSKLLDLAIQMLNKVDIRNTRFDDSVIRVLIPFIKYVGKFFLVLIIMDYLGIGETVIGAVLNAVSFAIAIALGLSFGKAFEKDAQSIYRDVKTKIIQ